MCRVRMTWILHSLLLVCLLPLLHQAVVRHSKPHNISSSCLCPLWVTLSIWAKTSSHTQPIYRCNLIPAAAKIILRCLLDRVFISIFMSACVNPPAPRVSARLNQILMRSKSAQPQKRILRVQPQRHFGHLKPISCNFTIDLHILCPSQPAKLTYCAKVVIITAARWFGNWGVICSLKFLNSFWHLSKILALCGYIIHSCIILFIIHSTQRNYGMFS